MGNFGLRRQAERDAALEKGKARLGFHLKALPPLRSASAVQKTPTPSSVTFRWEKSFCASAGNGLISRRIFHTFGHV
jgi:hypothetical protein